MLRAVKEKTKSERETWRAKSVCCAMSWMGRVDIGWFGRDRWFFMSMFRECKLAGEDKEKNSWG
jgi:hypothetical protein